MNRNMTAITCENGGIFSACITSYIDAEWKLQESYYKAQGCKVIQVDKVTFDNCNCEHHKQLEHNFESLIEEIRNL